MSEDRPDQEGGVTPLAPEEAARLGRLRAAHHARREHLYLCTCSGGRREVPWFGGGTICSRCGHWCKR